MREKLGLTTRDWIWIGTLVVGWIVNYVAVTSTMTARMASVERTVERMDARLWELRASRAQLLGTAPVPCPPDAMTTHLTDRGQR